MRTQTADLQSQFKSAVVITYFDRSEERRKSNFKVLSVLNDNMKYFLTLETTTRSITVGPHESVLTYLYLTFGAIFIIIACTQCIHSDILAEKIKSFHMKPFVFNREHIAQVNFQSLYQNIKVLMTIELFEKLPTYIQL